MAEKKETDGKVKMSYALVDEDGLYVRKVTPTGYKASIAAGGAKPFRTESAALKYKEEFKDRLEGTEVAPVPSFLFSGSKNDDD